MAFNIADLFEYAVDAVAERTAVVAGGVRRTYAELEGRANRLAHHLAERGIGAGDHVGIYAYNSSEFVEAMLAAYKLRAVAINVNYRYVDEELAYLFDNADLAGLVVQARFSPRVAAVRAGLPLLRHVVVIDDGSDTDWSALDGADYEKALAGASPDRDFGARSDDDIYILYTGGSTGMPKGVVWRHEDVFRTLGGGIDLFTGRKLERPTELAERAAAGAGAASFPIPPLMHGAAQWGTLGALFNGNKVVLTARFDAAEAWRLVEREQVNVMSITGDAMARPLVEALTAPGASYDVSSLLAISSSAAIFSPSVKEQFLERLPGVRLTDAIGASESGANGLLMVEKGKTHMKGGPTVQPGPDTTVLGDDGLPLAPGSGVIGRLARSGNVPLRYHKDPERSAATFVELGGTRYAIPGDFALLEADGSITLLGRGSVSINSGGEKIFPEEVEAAVKSHPGVFDAVVVGVPDERWGSRVAAIVQPRPGCEPTLEDVDRHCRSHIAGYKVPRELHLVAEMVRSPSGKPDYPWAERIARAGSHPGSRADP